MDSNRVIPAQAGIQLAFAATTLGSRFRGNDNSGMTASAAPGSRLARWWGSDLAYNFRRSPVAIVSAVVLFICLGAALFAPWVAPHNPFDLATLNLMDALTPPHGVAGARPEYLLGTDDQGRDLLSAIMFGRAHIACSSVSPR